MSFASAVKQKMADLLGLEVDSFTGRFYVPNPLHPADSGIKKLTIEFPTGEVFACDWPKVYPVLDKLEKELDAKLFNLNTRAGREERTRFIAERFGFVSLFVGNSDPTVFMGENKLVVGHRPYNEELDQPVGDDASPYREVAQVSTGLWWTTLIDIGALRTLLCRYLPDDATDALIAEVRSDTAEHTFFNVAPGSYNLYFDNDHMSLVEAAAGKVAHAENVSEPYCILTQENLDIVLGLESASPGPQ